MSTKVVGVGSKTVTAHSVTPRADDKPKEAMQSSADTAEAKDTTAAKKKAAAKQFKKADEAASPEQQAEARLSIAVRGY